MGSLFMCVFELAFCIWSFLKDLFERVPFSLYVFSIYPDLFVKFLGKLASSCCFPLLIVRSVLIRFITLCLLVSVLDWLGFGFMKLRLFILLLSGLWSCDYLFLLFYIYNYFQGQCCLYCSIHILSVLFYLFRFSLFPNLNVECDTLNPIFL